VQRVLVTGGSSPLGRLVTERLASRADVTSVTAVDVGESLMRVIDDQSIDTVIHARMCPSRSGAAVCGRPDVISTMQLAAAVSRREGPVRVVVAVSSTEVYPVRSSTPTWRRESEPLKPREDSVAARVLEAEDYVHDVAEAQPHVSVAVLRLADLVGPDIASPLTSLLRAPVLPYVAGYDPSVQFLHVDDAVDAIEHAAACELAGTFNVAANGAVHWLDVARRLRRPAVPAPVVRGPLAGVLRTLRAPYVPMGLLDTLRFGLCVDTSALADTGFIPNVPTTSCVAIAAR
jgi:UDP-glucose 4-epimerase